MKFAAKLRRCLSTKGMSQKQLAAQTGVSAAKVFDWVQSRFVPNLHEIALLATLFEFSADYLVFEEETGRTKPKIIGLNDDQRLVLDAWEALGISASDAVRAMALAFQSDATGTARVVTVRDHLKDEET